jgi:hypothetical protein
MFGYIICILDAVCYSSPSNSASVLGDSDSTWYKERCWEDLTIPIEPDSASLIILDHCGLRIGTMKAYIVGFLVTVIEVRTGEALELALSYVLFHPAHGQVILLVFCLCSSSYGRRFSSRTRLRWPDLWRTKGPVRRHIRDSRSCPDGLRWISPCWKCRQLSVANIIVNHVRVYHAANSRAP